MTWKLVIAVFAVTILVNIKLGVSRQGMFIGQKTLADHWNKNCVYYSPFGLTTQTVRVERACDSFVTQD